VWKCPKCGHRFTSRNLPHSCGRHRVADHLRDAALSIKQTYRRFTQIVRACGKVTIYAQKTRIVCMVDVRFASAIVRKNSLECGLWLDRRAEHPALMRIETYKNAEYHYFRFHDPSQLDPEFERLVQEAYAAHSRSVLR